MMQGQVVATAWRQPMRRHVGKIKVVGVSRNNLTNKNKPIILCITALEWVARHHFMKYIGIQLRDTGKVYALYTKLGLPVASHREINIYEDDSTELQEHYETACEFFGSKKGLDWPKNYKSQVKARVFISKLSPNDPNIRLLNYDIKFQSGGVSLRVPYLWVDNPAK